MLGHTPCLEVMARGEGRLFEGDGCSQHGIGRVSSEFHHQWNLTLIISLIPNGQVKFRTLIQVPAGA